jgi:hypothetical protein
MILINGLFDCFHISDELVYEEDSLGALGTTEDEHFGKKGIELLFHSLPKQQLEIVVCRALGFQPSEIVQVLGLRNIQHYYRANAELRRLYKERKARMVG